MTELNTAPQLAPHERCTGCAACCNGCPKGAIRMIPDREGFLYPQVTDGCVQCGHCTHICPVLKQREPRTEPAAFAVWNGDEDVRRRSTAGGAFSTLAEYVLEGGGVVFGAALDDGLKVSHIAVKNLHDLPRLRGAKPVQSDVGESYQQTRLYLDQGRQVPPMYSAIKIGGQKLYELARKGQEIERPARTVTIHGLALLEPEEPGGDWRLRVRCSKGTYVRTLCPDIGQALGCGGCMSSLRRTMAAGFTLAEGRTIEEVQQQGESLLAATDSLFRQYPAYRIPSEQADRRCRCGNPLTAEGLQPGLYRVYGTDGTFLCLSRWENGVLTSEKNFFGA